MLTLIVPYTQNYAAYDIDLQVFSTSRVTAWIKVSDGMILRSMNASWIIVQRLRCGDFVGFQFMRRGS